MSEVPEALQTPEASQTLEASQMLEAQQKSKSQKKREMTALQALGEELVRLKPCDLPKLHLPETLHGAILAARTITSRGARRRQMQYIGRLMREVEATPIQHALDALKGHQRQATADFHRLERWRERLFTQGEEALEELIVTYPSADRQHLRQLLRNAEKEKAGNKPPRAARALFHYLRKLLGGWN